MNLKTVGDLAPFYVNLYKNINTSDFKNLPFVTHDSIANNPEAFLVKDRSFVTDVFTGSGYSKKEKRIFMTEKDVQNLQIASKNLLTKLTDLELGKETLIITKLEDQTIAKFSAERIISSLSEKNTILDMYNQKGILESIHTKKPEVIFAPYILMIKLIGYFPQLSQFGIKRVFVGGLSLPDSARKKIESSLDIKVTNMYGCSEAGGFFAAEKDGEQGYHLVSPDYLHLEIIGKDGKPSNKGDIVITTLQKEGTQLIRYKTGDIGEMIKENCDCDYGGQRFKVLGRKDNMKLIGQMNFFFTSDIDEAIISVPGIKDYLIELDCDKDNYDVFRVLVKGTVKENDLINSLKCDDELYRQITNNIIKFQLKKVKELLDSGLGYKTKKIIDKRE
ncbi:MAG: hypothetical protein ABIB43_03935 [archaeon]